ncbi:gamma-glutamyltransferase family protein [Cupriavidus consociatus]|uniref:gamma-glutamyltransferase family protein n=1 Tax=Cupriavidus consociatus TaxID=2821357 RepID=UPI001AE38BDC|nr:MULTISPECIES: gamma-glutamyltransferase family protein [unclassified Cupriavidus]MBP0621242.1 gamma-glutamyltransferase family protein [Cupriavidus sp. LEh25]MDK2657914.1 gamma-glutamyltransferase family protein [Cupriavidus sp. LEh21]
MFTTRPEIVGTFGVAASTHWLATQTAMGVLERGGNAFDAAVAAGFVLQVVEPHLNGPGGEVPIMFWSERERRMRTLCGQGPAPALADPAALRAQGLELVPGIGLVPATVPGAFGAWLTMLRDHGTWSLAEVLAPAIGYARDGFPLVPRISRAILAVRALFRDEWHSSAATWLPDGKVPRPGSLHTLPVLADTYTRIVEDAQRRSDSRTGQIDAALECWYRGFVAEEIDAYCRNTPVRDTTGDKHTGLLRYDDMAGWSPEEEDPVTLDFGRYTVAKCDIWSQGPVFLQQLGMLRHAGLARHAPDSPDFVHRIAEATKLAMADRLAWYGDPGFTQSPLAALLDDGYLAARAQRIGERAALAIDPGTLDGMAPRLPDPGAAERTLQQADVRFGVGEPTFAELPPVAEWAERELFVGDTCHIDVIDRHGNMVAATPSGGWLSSSPTIPALGFALNTRLQMTWLEPGLPNSLAPGKRPCTTLSPSLALRDGEPYMVFGTPGGDQQDQWSLAFFLRHAVHGMNLQEAIDAPAWHIDHFPGSFWPRQTVLNRISVESRFPAATLAALRERGHEVRVGEPWSEGRMSACSRERDGRGRLVLRAGANARGMQGYAVGR